MKRIAITISLFLIAVLVLFAGGPYKITKILPGQKIRIGNKWCGLDSVFYETQVVHWDRNLPRQAFEANDVNNPSITIGMSKRRTRQKDISYKDYEGLITKGETDDDSIVLWPGELICIEGIIVDDGYMYSCRVRGMSKEFALFLRNGKVFINSDDFKDISSEIKLEICKTNVIKQWDVRTIKVITVE